MQTAKTLTFVLMDAPFESESTATAFRLLTAAITAGHHVNVFAYEGAAALSFARQARHANAVHSQNGAEELHPLPREWIAALQQQARERDVRFDWVNCGLCVDERGAGETINGVRGGSPADLWALAERSDNSLVIAMR